MLYWHYATDAALQRIMADGEIRPSRSDGPLPVVYFSANPMFERAADKLIHLRPQAAQDMIPPDGAARIGVDPEHFPLTKLGEFNRLSMAKSAADDALFDAIFTPSVIETLCRWFDSLYARLGVAFDWRVSFEPVPLRKWAKVDRWNGERWEAVNVACAAT